MEETKLAQKIERIADQKELTPEALASYLKSFLERYDLIALFPKIVEILKVSREESMREKTVFVRSRYSLDQDTLAEIAHAVGASPQTPIKHVKDISVLGGFIAEYKGVVYNASLAKQVEKIQLSLKKVEV